MGDGDEPVQINVTPLIDVIFCLCLFFMCSFHFKQLEGRVEAWLPRNGNQPVPATRTPVFEDVRVLVRLNESSGRVEMSYGSRVVPDVRALERLVAEGWRERVAQGRKDVPVVIDGDARVPWKSVLAVFDACKKSGVEAIELAQPWPALAGGPRRG